VKHDEHRVRAVLRRYLAPALADRALDELRAVDSPAPAAEPAPLPALAPPTELDLARVERLARRRGMVVMPKGRNR